MNEEKNENKKLPGVLIAVLWFAVILIFALSSVLSYQGMSQILIYDEPGPLTTGVWEIDPSFFRAGRITCTVGTLLIWFLFLRKNLVRCPENKKIRTFIFGIVTIICVSVLSWFASTFAVFVSTGFIDIQPKWADNAYIINIPVYIFGAAALADTVLIFIRRVRYKDNTKQ